ncbi:MAG: hypothetical protein QHJ73_18915, partial [Armatimonadota bacterium]|nr:hypothetical protein [Armatimonadota bacterium]
VCVGAGSGIQGSTGDTPHPSIRALHAVTVARYSLSWRFGCVSSPAGPYPLPTRVLVGVAA